MMDDKKLLFELEIRGTKEELDALQKVNANIKQMQEELKTVGKTDKLREAQLKTNIKIEQANARQITKNLQNINTLAENGINTLKGQKAQLGLVNAELDKTDKGTAKFAKLTAEANKLTSELKGAEGAAGNFRRNVGDYKDQADAASLSVNEMRKAIRALREEPLAGKSQQEIEQLNTRIGVLTDSMQKLRMEQESKGMDAMAAFAGSMQMASASAQILAGGMNALGIESKVLQNLQQNVMGLIAITHGLKTIEDTLNKKTVQRTASLISETVATKVATFESGRLAAAKAMEAKAQTASTAAGKLGYTAMAKLNAIMAANPALAIASGIIVLTGAVVGLYMIVTKKNKELERERELNAEINSQYAEQASEVLFLNKQIENNNLGNKTRIDAINRLKEIMPDYNGELDKEGKLINHNTNEIAAYLVQLKEKIRLQTIDNQMRAAISEEQTARLRLEAIKNEVETQKLSRQERGKLAKEYQELWKTIDGASESQAFLTTQMEAMADTAPPTIDAAIEVVETKTGSGAAAKANTREVQEAVVDELKIRLDKLQQLETLDRKEMELAGATANELLQLQADYLAMRLTALEAAGLQETFAYQEMEVDKLLIEKRITDSEKKEHEERLQILELAKQKEKEMQDVWALADAVNSDERFAIEKQQMEQRHLERLAALEIQETDAEAVREAKRIERELAEEEHQRRLANAEKKHNQERIASELMLRDAKIAAAQSVLGAMGSIFSQGAQQNKLLFGLEKATALGQAFLNLKNGLAKTSASAPFPANIPLIAGFVGQTAGIIGSMAAVKEPQVPRFASGVIGLDGAGTSTSDSIDAKLSKGESVVTAKATRAFAGELAAMEMAVGNVPNYGYGKRRFADGVIGATPLRVNGIQLADEVLRVLQSQRIYVVESDITDTQNIVRKLKVEGDL